jgi:hypothetical protein
MPEGRRAIPFSVRTPVWHHEAWNSIPLHQPDSDVVCLPKGATEAFLVTQAPTVAQLPPGETRTPEEFWVGRRAILRSPASADEPARAFAITITAVSHLVDNLVLTSGLPTNLTHIHWTEPTPWPLQLARTSALMNIVQVVAGEEIVERFRVGSDQAAAARHPALTAPQLRDVLALPRAVERQGPIDIDRGARDRILRYGLRGSETRGLGWEGARDPLGIGTQSAQHPMLNLREVLPPAFVPDPAATPWVFHRDILTADLDTPAFALEEGMWRTVVTHQTPFEDVVFQDYAGDDGWSLRFGDGAFRTPAGGRHDPRSALFQRRGHGREPVARQRDASQSPPDAPPGALFGYASAATNPLAIVSGGDEETAADIRISAPEAWRALPLRAVRPEDYSSIVERLDWVQRANSVTAWTGSWSTDFVAADPLGGVEYTADERAELEHVVDCIVWRRATRGSSIRTISTSISRSKSASPRARIRARSFRASSRRWRRPACSIRQLHLRPAAAPLRARSRDPERAGRQGRRGDRIRVRRRREWKVFDQAELRSRAAPDHPAAERSRCSRRAVRSASPVTEGRHEPVRRSQLRLRADAASGAAGHSGGPEHASASVSSRAFRNIARRCSTRSRASRC